jgi:hypothetical protein
MLALPPEISYSGNLQSLSAGGIIDRGGKYAKWEWQKWSQQISQTPTNV